MSTYYTEIENALTLLAGRVQKRSSLDQLLKLERWLVEKVSLRNDVDPNALARNRATNCHSCRCVRACQFVRPGFVFQEEFVQTCGQCICLADEPSDRISLRQTGL